MSLLDQPNPPKTHAGVRTVTKLNARAPVTADDNEPLPPPTAPAPAVKKKRGRKVENVDPSGTTALVLRALISGPALSKEIEEVTGKRPEQFHWVLTDQCDAGLMRRLGQRRSRCYELTPKGRKIAEALEASAETPTPPRRRPVVDVAGLRSPATCESNTGSRRDPVASSGSSPPHFAVVSRHLQRWFSQSIFVVGVDDTHVTLAVPIERITDASIGGLINPESL